jgi:hypothetical protein
MGVRTNPKHRLLVAGLLASCAVAGALIAAGCGGDSGGGGDSHYKPTVTTSWQIQLQVDGTHPLDRSHAVDLYDIDLVDNSSATIAALHADGRKVICYFSTAWEDWRPDAGDFPAAVLGNDMGGWPGEKWIDIRDPRVLAIMEARMDLAVDKGCDGVDPDNVHAYEMDIEAADGETTGFNLTAADQLAFNRALAAAAHQRGLAIGLKNDLLQVSTLVSDFDFSINEQCYFYNECSYLDPFIDAGKPVFHLEYDAKYQVAGADQDALCNDSINRDHRTLIMPLLLDGSSRISCD